MKPHAELDIIVVTVARRKGLTFKEQQRRIFLYGFFLSISYLYSHTAFQAVTKCSA